MKRKIKITSKMLKRTFLWALLIALVTIFSVVVVKSFGSGHIYSNSSIPESVDALGDYKRYLDENGYVTGNEDLTPATSDIVALGVEAINTTFHTETFQGQDALLTTTNGSATWEFEVKEAGFYNIKLDYMPYVGTSTDEEKRSGGANIERKVYINDEVPFGDLRNVSFQRVWGDGGEKKVDNTGNEIRPLQIEKPERRVSYIKDQVGYVTEPYLIYFKEGINTIKLESIREPMAVFGVIISSKETYKSYDEVYQDYVNQGYKKVTGKVTGYYNEDSDLIEGEDSIKRSSSTIYAISDRTSAFSSPSDPVKLILNSIGGNKWKTPGDWITWEFTVPETGLYNISMRAKQSSSRGLFSTRKVYIDGAIPFAEAQNSKFIYSSNWNIVTLGTEDTPFYFYLTEGTHEITLEATLGEYGSQINRVQNTIDELTSMYRQIISKTGINPDKYIDYKLTEKIPTLIETFNKSAKTLDDVAKTITRISGEKSGESASLETMAIQLRKFIDNPRTIQRNLVNFSNNISSLGTWILTVSSQALTIDYLIVHSNDYELPKANPNFFGATWFGIKAFFQSFFFDYSSIGSTDKNADYESVEVWFLTSEVAGREQANAIRTLIDTTFGEKYNIDLKVVGPETLLTATLAGRGPDVAINAYNGTPINYAMRGAIENIAKKDSNGNYVYEGFEDVTGWFQESAMTPYEFNGGYYALPNTQSFLMLFYREDIFEAQNWPVPETWKDVIDLIPELQVQNLQFYLPLNTVGASSIVNQIFASRLYQTGGSFYRTDTNSEGKTYMESNFDSEQAMEAFEFWSDFYTSYGFSLTITANTFINRFRSGEMPIGIAPYDTYNTLAVSAPEIRGKWKFEVIPGTEKSDGTIDHSGAASGTAVMMMKQADQKQGAWEFMKWWVSEETQVGYAREVEAILGSAARHPTANKEAFKRLAWTIEERNVLVEQWDVTVGVPEVPGGYYTGRNLENAFREVVNNNLNPRDTLADYIFTINKELNRKRAEFGLGISD